MSTVYSSTGTAPIVVTPYGPGLVSLDFEDGTGQVYRVRDLLGALGLGVSAADVMARHLEARR